MRAPYNQFTHHYTFAPVVVSVWSGVDLNITTYSCTRIHFMNHILCIEMCASLCTALKKLYAPVVTWSIDPFYPYTWCYWLPCWSLHACKPLTLPNNFGISFCISCASLLCSELCSILNVTISFRITNAKEMINMNISHFAHYIIQIHFIAKLQLSQVENLFLVTNHLSYIRHKLHTILFHTIQIKQAQSTSFQ